MIVKIFPAICLTASLASTSMVFAQSGPPRDRRLEQAQTDIALLKRVVKEQDRRIADLEKMVKGQQSTAGQVAAAPPPPVSASAKPARSTIPWHQPSTWERIKAGMSRREVEDILGPPTTSDSVIDYQTLTYKDAAPNGAVLVGSIKLVDDRVSQIAPPSF